MKTKEVLGYSRGHRSEYPGPKQGEGLVTMRKGSDHLTAAAWLE